MSGDLEFVQAQIDRDSDRMLVKSWLAGKSAHTKRNYERVATELLSWIHPRRLQQAFLHDFQAFVEGDASRGKSSIAFRTSVVKSLLSYGFKTGYLPANHGAFLPGMKVPSRLTERYLTEEEVHRMIACTPDRRDRAILLLLYGTGMRVGALVNLHWSDIQERGGGEGQVRVKEKGDRTHYIRVDSVVWEALQELRSDSTKDIAAVFSLTDRAVREVIFKAAVRAGIQKRVSPHWLRHAHASHALDHGAPIQLVQSTLGHASVATTGRYLHARPQESSGRYLSLSVKK